MTIVTSLLQRIVGLAFGSVILLVAHHPNAALAWTPPQERRRTTRPPSSFHEPPSFLCRSRREFMSMGGTLLITASTTTLVVVFQKEPVMAYTPDSDKLRECLYLISRVQEATVQQERFVMKATLQQDLKAKMKLTLRLVEKNYRLLDQINYASGFVNPKEDLVTASEAGYEAVDALQGAIDFVRDDLGEGPLSDAQRSFLVTSLQSCRENLFVFVTYMPDDKLMGARKRVEEENVLNRDEFDGDADAGVYNPVVLPWKNWGS